MVGSRKLSNEEVEALLSGLNEEASEQKAEQFDPNEVREFKFATHFTEGDKCGKFNFCTLA